jgi:hypothetical protein
MLADRSLALKKRRACAVPTKDLMYPRLTSSRHPRSALYQRYVRRPHLTREQLEASRPFTSENTWRLLSDHRLDRPPTLLEYGSGTTTYYHLQTLAACRDGQLPSRDR